MKGFRGEGKDNTRQASVAVLFYLQVALYQGFREKRAGFSLGFFGEAKKSDSPAGAIPG
jgi:hypothetical protein